MNKAILLIVSIIIYTSALAQPELKPPAGRIAIVADENLPDPDDLGGTTISIAVLRATGLEDRLVHYSYSCLKKASVADVRAWLLKFIEANPEK
ncbi:MAG: hypothetical protein JXQ96_12305 [Cyclobacteriaceae bacterium]